MRHAYKQIERRLTATSAGGKRFWRIHAPDAEVLAVQIVWHDGTSAFNAPVYYSSCLEEPDETATAGTVDLEQWFDESVSTSALVAGNAGSVVHHITSKGSRWFMLEIEPTADCILSIYAHGKS